MLTPYKQDTTMLTPYKQDTAMLTPYKQDTAMLTSYTQDTSMLTPYKQDTSMLTPYKRDTVNTKPSHDCHQPHTHTHVSGAKLSPSSPSSPSVNSGQINNEERSIVGFKHNNVFAKAVYHVTLHSTEKSCKYIILMAFARSNSNCK